MSDKMKGMVIGGVGAPVPKKDASALLTGKPVYVRILRRRTACASSCCTVRMRMQ